MNVASWSILAFISFAVKGGAENPARGDSRVCPEVAVDRTQEKLYKPVTSLGMRCIQQVVRKETFDSLKSTMHLEEVRIFYRDFCQKRSAIGNCFDEQTSNIEVCQHENFLSAFKIYYEFWKVLIDFGCSHEGEKFTILFHGVMTALSNATTNLPLGNCMWRSSNIFNEIQNTSIDYPSKFYLLNQEVSKLKECMLKVDLEPNFKEVLESALDTVHDKMKCIQPLNGSLVLCRDIDSAQVAHPSSCEVFFSGAKVVNKKRYDLYGEGTTECFQHVMALDEMSHNISENSSLLRNGIEEFCHKANIVSYCILRKSIFADCFTRTQQEEFRMLEYFVIDTLNIACACNGERLANILFEVFRLKRASPEHRNIITECISNGKAETQKRLGGDYETSSLRFYFVLGHFKECFLKKLQGNVNSHRGAQWLLEEILRTSECIHPQTKAKLLCSTIVNN